MPCLAAGCRRETALCVWHTREPFRPLVERNGCKGGRALAWLPNGIGCMAGGW